MTALFERAVPRPPAPTQEAADTLTELDAPRAPSTLWDPATLSQGYVADYKPFVMTDGPGVRCAVYVSGCTFQCPGCFNRAAWSFRYGQRYTHALEDRIVADVAKQYVQGVSLLGGEPFLNTHVCLSVVRRVRAQVPGKDVWAWSGFTFEWLLTHGTTQQRTLLDEVDVLVDGPFRQDLKDLTLPFRGSANQRLVDVPQSLRAGRVVPWIVTGIQTMQCEGRAV